MPNKGSVRRRVLPRSLIKGNVFKAFSKHTGKKDRKQFDLIAHALFSRMAEYIKDDIEGFKLPFNMGILMVIRYKPRHKRINVRRSVQLGQLVYYQNLHSFGDSIAVTWIKPEYLRYRNMECYYFVVERSLGRQVSDACLSGKVYKKIESRERYAREMIALDNIQERYDTKIHKRML